MDPYYTHATLSDMKTTSYELPVRFQKLFTSVAALSLLTYCGGIIFQYFSSLHVGYGSLTAWEGVSLVAKLALPLVMLAIGVRMSQGSWWRRFMIGALCANGALLAYVLLLMASGLVGAALPLDYSIVDALLSFVTLVLWVSAIWLFRTRERLWGRRYVAYVAGIVSVILAYTVFSVVSMIGMAADSGWLDWSAMLIAHLVVILLSLVAYFTLSGLPRTQRLFRVVLVMMVGFMGMAIFADIMSIIAQSLFAAGSDLFGSSAYMIASTALPVLAYGIALWWVRPVVKKSTTSRLTTVKI